METGTYLTDIGIEKEHSERSSSPQKFTRFDETYPVINSRPASPPPANCFRISKKNYCQFLSEDYYENKKVKPGFNFYRTILQADEKRKKNSRVPSLRINMPQTLIMSDNCYQLIHSHQGEVQIKQDVNITDFMKIVKKDLHEQESYQRKPLYPGSLLVSGNGIGNDFTIFLSSQLDSRIYPKNQNMAAIKFIMPFGNTPNIMRLYYTPKGIRGAKPNHGYKIANKKHLGEQIYSRKYKLIHNYLVDSSKQDYIVVTPVKGKALLQLESMAESMIKLLQYLNKVKIQQFVVDFIFGSDRKYYFHEIKSIKSVTLYKKWDIGNEQEIKKLVEEKNNQIYCRLCAFSFTKQEMTHIVTNKLIIELVAHIKGRGLHIETPFIGQITGEANLSGSSHVCQLCYDLIIAEHKLIDVEHQFCSMINMKFDSVDRVSQMLEICKKDTAITTPNFLKTLISIIPKEPVQKEESQKKDAQNGQALFLKFFKKFAPEPSPQPQFLTLNQQIKPKGKLYQWRMFFYIEKVKNIPLLQSHEDNYISHFNLSFTFDDMKEKFQKLEDFYPVRNQSKNSGVTCQKGDYSRLSSTRVQSVTSFSRLQSSQGSTPMIRCRTSKVSQHNPSNNRPLTSIPKSLTKQSHQQMQQDTQYLTIQKPLQNQKGILDVQKVKLLVFYTETTDIKKIFNDHQLKFELTQNQGCIEQKKNQFMNSRNSRNSSFTHTQNNSQSGKINFIQTKVLKGQSSTLQNFTNKQQCQRHSCQVLLFDDEYTYCNLELNVGLICDGTFQVGDQVEKSTIDDHIFFPTRMKRNCNPLPQQWIQVLTDGLEFEDLEKKYDEEMKNLKPQKSWVSKKSGGESSILRPLNPNSQTIKRKCRKSFEMQKKNRYDIEKEWNIAEKEQDEQQFI